MCSNIPGIPGLIQVPVGYAALSTKSKDRAPRFQSQTRPETLSQGWANVQTLTAAFLSHLGILKSMSSTLHHFIDVRETY